MLIFLLLPPSRNLCYMDFHRKAHGKVRKQTQVCADLPFSRKLRQSYSEVLNATLMCYTKSLEN